MEIKKAHTHYSVFGHPHNLVFGKMHDSPADFSIDCYNRRGKKKNSYNYLFTKLDLHKEEKTNFSSKKDIHSMFFDDERFKKDFNQAKISIERNEIKKVVIYNTLVLRLNKPFNAFSSLNKIQSANKSHFVYGQWTHNQGIIGLSPEILFKKSLPETNKFTTVSLAGTTSKEQSSKMLNDSRFNTEQGLVTEHFKEIFSKKNLPFNISKTQLEPYHNLVHLKQNIDFKYEGDGESLISELAPTPAVGIYPVRFLDKYWDNFVFNHESDFDLYGGVFHYNQSGKSDAIVMIRNIQWVNNLIYINAGCGIIKQSNFDEELKESKSKIVSVLELLL